MILLLATIGSIAGLIGGAIFLVKIKWAKKLSEHAIPFAAGVLLSTSLLHLIPEAIRETGEIGYTWVLGALLASFFFEQFFAHLHHHNERRGTLLKATVPLVIFGDTIHNFIDGVAIAAAYITDPFFGFVVTLATFLHETPHEIGDFGVLMAAGWTRTRTMTANVLSALATFPGALLVFFFMREADETIGILLAISAGVFLYLGASDFLPEVGEEGRRTPALKNFLLLLTGISVMYILALISP